MLILVPWSTFWERNYFAEVLPAIRPWLANNFVRGAVSGLGFVNLLAAGAELADVFGRRAESMAHEGDRLGDHG